MHENAWTARTSVLAAAASALAAALCLTLATAIIDGPSVPDIAISAGFWIVVIAFALLAGGGRGLLVLWLLVGVFWLFGIWVQAKPNPEIVRDAVLMLPAWFATWSSFALPLVLVTAYALLREGTRRQTALVIPAAWCCLALASGVLASYARDVGPPNPRHDPVLAWPAAVVGIVVPGLLVWWAMRALSTTRS